MLVNRRSDRPVCILLRLEGGCVALLTLILYYQIGTSWWLFAVLVLLPDVAIMGYLLGPIAGAHIYNAAHNYVAPAILWCVLTPLAIDLADALALIWVFHVGADRILGYGLKYTDSFKSTHLSGPRSDP